MSECKCLNNGQCLMNNETSNYYCVCTGCTGGEFCQNRYYYVQYSMSSSMLINILMEESASTRLTLKFLFIFLFSLLTVVSFINSLLTLSTCFIRKIRITICGLYIIIYSIFSFIGIALLEIIAVVALFYNDELNKYPVIHCALIPMFLYLTFNIYLWLSAFIAVERLLIQLFHYSHYRTRKYAIMFLIILFIFLSSASVITALGRTVGKSPIFQQHTTSVHFIIIQVKVSK